MLQHLTRVVYRSVCVEVTLMQLLPPHHASSVFLQHIRLMSSLCSTLLLSLPIQQRMSKHVLQDKNGEGGKWIQEQKGGSHSSGFLAGRKV